jgi:hypothetical protein
MPRPSAPFTHLQIASGYSLQYGTAMPDAIAQHVADLGQPIAGLTDRDGLYGAVRWMLACRETGVRPVLGVDLAMEETAPIIDRATRTLQLEGGSMLFHSPTGRGGGSIRSTSASAAHSSINSAK